MLRQFPSSLPGEARFFLGTNRGKRALALDLKQKEGLAVLHRMVESADVLVENFRPSVPARLGIDYPRLRAINPRLIYAGLTGYGDEGPLSDKGGFDQVLQCLTGMAVFQGGGAGEAAAGARLGARLFHLGVARLRRRRGAVPAREERQGAISEPVTAAQRADDPGRPFCLGRERGARRGPRFRHRRADRHPSDKTGRRSISRCIRTISSPRCASWSAARSWRATRAASRCAAAPSTPPNSCRKSAPRSPRAPRSNGRRFSASACRARPCGRSRTCSTIRRSSPRISSTTLDHPVVGRYRTMTKPVRFSETPGPAPTAAPVFGQHSDEVLAAHGYSDAEIAALRERGVVR